MISILTVDMPTDAYDTADEPSQCLGKHSFAFVCVSINYNCSMLNACILPDTMMVSVIAAIIRNNSGDLLGKK